MHGRGGGWGVGVGIVRLLRIYLPLALYLGLGLVDLVVEHVHGEPAQPDIGRQRAAVGGSGRPKKKAGHVPKRIKITIMHYRVPRRE